MRVISLNVNGLRAATRKGLKEFLQGSAPEIVCLQELKADETSLAAVTFETSVCRHFAEKKGYSGVAILSRREPDRVVAGMGLPDYDREGRVLRADFGGVSVLSVYVPSGASKAERQRFKMRFLEDFLSHTARLLAEGRELLVCGDFNIAHRPIDLKNWRANQQSSGFLPEERAWLDRFLALGLHDSYRELIGPDTPSYSWWSLRTGARARNVGWRLDYQFATPGLNALAVRGCIPVEPNLSDHAPVIVDYEGL